MRLAVISDIHGNLAALEAVLADIKARGVDRTVNLGDCVTSPLWPKETFEALQSLSLPTVRGNHDRWIEEFPDDKLSPAGLFARNALTAEQRSRTPRFAVPNTAGRRDPGLPRHARRRYDVPARRSARGRPLRAGASRRADRAPFERANGACRAVWSQPPPGGCSGPGRPPGPQSRQRWLPGVRGHSFCRKPGASLASRPLRDPHETNKRLASRTAGPGIRLGSRVRAGARQRPPGMGGGHVIRTCQIAGLATSVIRSQIVPHERATG